MRDLETARLLLAAAGRDLTALSHMTNPEAFPVEVFGFHAQQAAEKSLKAWLAILGIPYQMSHNIRHLVTLLEQSGEEVADLWGLADLSGFAVQFRYAAYDMTDEEIDRPTVIA